MSDAEIVQAVTAFLTTEIPEGDLGACDCKDCKQIVAQAVAEGFVCAWCGYAGEPFTLDCACYEESALYCRPGAPGPGCFHGALACRWCDCGDGDRSPWEAVREIRALVMGRPVPATEGGAA